MLSLPARGLGTFRDAYIPTIEDTYRQVISCNKNVCTLQITDTTGSHQFPAMQRLNISKGHAFMLVYSVSSKQSMEELIPIYRQIMEVKGQPEGLPIILVGNKCDEDNREVTVEYTAEMIDKILKGCNTIETSAKTGNNVQEAFQVGARIAGSNLLDTKAFCFLFQELLAMDKTRNMSLKMDLKKSRSQIRKEKLKGHCSLM